MCLLSRGDFLHGSHYQLFVKRILLGSMVKVFKQSCRLDVVRVAPAICLHTDLLLLLCQSLEEPQGISTGSGYVSP